jgi:hypothetical protein
MRAHAADLAQERPSRPKGIVTPSSAFIPIMNWLRLRGSPTTGMGHTPITVGPLGSSSLAENQALSRECEYPHLVTVYILTFDAILKD